MYLANNLISKQMKMRYISQNKIVALEIDRTMTSRGWVVWQMTGDTTGLPSDPVTTKREATEIAKRISEETGLPIRK